jgi:hypothetical protein
MPFRNQNSNERIGYVSMLFDSIRIKIEADVYPLKNQYLYINRGFGFLRYD